MDTHLMIGLGILLGAAAAAAATRDLLRAMKARAKLVPVRVRASSQGRHRADR
ncbi:hypothetical protein ABWH74_005709 [Burkholderia vietnamiensis]|jgi:hypothetical protein|uniref:hypothetical protein n=1 Tax=Burkholderia TaxID=32008 RepID=UPI00003A5D91|nr:MULTISPECIES: hypothetical protein [Burkholderia]MBR8165486.1 hypothetical protein [Burkholderia vietnamiensis]MBR8283005.1 hypothetical protein [Burkholderia vietnamiensis]MBR8360898.1 hypothetical protein [Burkholderia vietnamiensis]MCA8146814.1 hypothetical protein [Burkholderia vietnamiensis]MCA8183114.1 hypothetical protein [Burkholderia vietnamiensis]